MPTSGNHFCQLELLSYTLYLMLVCDISQYASFWNSNLKHFEYLCIFSHFRVYFLTLFPSIKFVIKIQCLLTVRYLTNKNISLCYHHPRSVWGDARDSLLYSLQIFFTYIQTYIHACIIWHMVGVSSPLFLNIYVVSVLYYYIETQGFQ